MTKRCRICGETKPLNEFYGRPNSRDGHRNDCKSCHKKIRAEYNWRRRYPERSRAGARKYYSGNPRLYRMAQKRWQAKHPEKYDLLMAKSVLAKEMGVPRRLVPMGLVQAKALQVALGREVRSRRKVNG